MGFNLWTAELLYLGVGIAIGALCWIALRFSMGKLGSLSSMWRSRKYQRRAGPLQLDKNVQFTIYWPRAIEPEKQYKLLAFAHLSERRAAAPEDEPDPVEEVQRQAQESLGDQENHYNLATEDTRHAVPQEQGLTFLPKLPGIIFDPPYHPFLWYGPVHQQVFKIKALADKDGRTITGSMKVFLGRILLAEIPISIRVDSKKAEKYQTPPLKVVSASPYRKIFASYSHLDDDIVKEFEDYAKALGDDYLRDVRTLRAGEQWSKRLEEMIVEANVFQLFWSTHSMRSQFVREEWEYALKLNRPNFIRPIYWEDPLPKEQDLPPQSLLDLHFQRFPPETRRPRWNVKQGATILSAIFLAGIIINMLTWQSNTGSVPQLKQSDEAASAPSATPLPNSAPRPDGVNSTSNNSGVGLSLPTHENAEGRSVNPERGAERRNPPVRSVGRRPGEFERSREIISVQSSAAPSATLPPMPSETPMATPAPSVVANANGSSSGNDNMVANANTANGNIDTPEMKPTRRRGRFASKRRRGSILPF